MNDFDKLVNSILYAIHHKTPIKWEWKLKTEKDDEWQSEEETEETNVKKNLASELGQLAEWESFVIDSVSQIDNILTCSHLSCAWVSSESTQKKFKHMIW